MENKILIINNVFTVEGGVLMLFLIILSSLAIVLKLKNNLSIVDFINYNKKVYYKTTYAIKQDKNDIILLGVLMLLFGVFILKSSDIFGKPFLNEIHNNFEIFIAETIVYISNLINNPISYIFLSNKLIYEDVQLNVVLPVKAYPFLFGITIFIFLVPFRKMIYFTVYVFSSILFVYVRSVLITLIMLYYTGSKYSIVLLFFDTTIFLPILVWLYWIIKNNTLLKKLYDSINLLILKNSNYSVIKIVFIILLVNPILRILITIIGGIPIHKFIILKLMSIFLSVFGYQTTIISDTIYFHENWIRLGDPCLGIGLMSIIILLVLIVKCHVINKLLYIPFFILIFNMVNVIRLSYSLVYINLNQKGGINLSNLHDNITYVMYFTTFVLFVLYINWFSNIKFSKYINPVINKWQKIN